MRAPRPPIPAVLLVAALLGVAACETARSERDRSVPVARINGHALSNDQFDRFLTVKLGDFAGEPLGDAVRSELFDEFVKREVTAQAARDRGLAAAPLETSVETDAARSLVDEQAIDTLVQRYLTEFVLKDVTVSPEEIARFYEANLDAYCPADGFYVRELRLTTRESAERARRDLVAGRRGEATSDASRVYDPSALPPQFKKAVTPLGDGEVSQIVRSTYGYHLFVRERCGDDKPPARVRDRVTSDLRATKNEQRVTEAVERLLREATVEVNPDQLSFHYEGRFAYKK